MSMPLLAASIAFASEPGAASPSYSSVETYVQGFAISRGRQYETDQMGAGTCTLVLDNRDRRFDTELTSGPYGSGVKVMRRMKLEASWDSVLYPLFDGYVVSYDPIIAPNNGDAVVIVQAADGVEVLSNSQVDGSFPVQRTDLRIGAILDAIGWPAAARDLGIGLIDTQAITLTDANVWQHLLQIVGDEAGTIFLSADGKVTFQDRYARLRPDVTSLLTIGDLAGGGELAVDIGFAKDRTRIINYAAVTRQGGTQQITSNAASITTYYRRAVSRSGLHVDDGAAYGLAGFLSERYAQPQLRAKQVRLDYADDPTTMWPHILGREIGDRITLARTPPGGGSAISQSVTIEGIQFRWQAEGDDWQEMAWSVSPNDTNQYWILNDATYGVLSSTTRLAP